MLCPGIGAFTVLGELSSGEDEEIHLPLPSGTSVVCFVVQAPEVLAHQYVTFTTIN